MNLTREQIPTKLSTSLNGCFAPADYTAFSLLLNAFFGEFIMAIRSGAGTGVIVSLVVFVLATVFLLVLSIVFYVGNREQMETVKNAESMLHVYATSRERSDDYVIEFVALADAANQSVIGYLNDQLEQRNRMLTGNPSETIDQLQNQFSGNVSESSPLVLTLANLQARIKSMDNELANDKLGLASADDTIQSLNDQLDTQAQSKDAEMQQVRVEWQDVQDWADSLNETATDEFQRRGEYLEEVRIENRVRMQDAENRVAELIEERAQLMTTIDVLRSRINSNRMSTVDPSLLIDGRVLEVGSGNEVFIDRGEQDHIVLGLTFDIYESASQLRFDENGNLPRGKATIEVVKVGPTTSTAKIKRSTSSQPIIRDNIIVNPVYDPDYKFSFIVHGNFDADGDGEPESNNSFIKNQIYRWGGIVIEDDGVIPGDLDFLVLGIAPRKPTGKPKPNATNAMRDAYSAQTRAYEDYESLRDAATSAQVPILTANRLDVLTGHRSR